MSDQAPRPLQTPGGKLTLKIGILLVSVLVLLIPLVMIRGLVTERQMRRDAAVEEMIASWGGRQNITGPVLVIPVTVSRLDGEETLTHEESWRLIPATTQTSVALQPEVRERGIYRTAVYVAVIDIAGTFAVPAAPSTGIRDPHVVHWDEAQLVMGLASPTGLRLSPEASWNAQALELQAGSETLGSGRTSVAAGIPAPVAPGSTHSFAVQLTVSGGDEFTVLPLAASAAVRIESSWPSPSFFGSILPTRRELAEDGFVADWDSTALGLGIPESWLAGSGVEMRLHSLDFGAQLFMPVDHYARTERSVKYGVLFVLIPFIALFLFEVFARTRIHPVQYLLVGAANVVFYLLLLSLSEHLPFNWSYALAAGATVAVVTVYAAAVLSRRGRGVLLGGIVAAEYLFLFATLGSEDYALLIGAGGLFAVLAVVMMATRHVDWYRPSGPDHRRPRERSR